MSVMSTNKSDFVIDLQNVFNLPNTCQDVNVKEEFCWGSGDQQLFEGEAVEFDMESFIKDEEERTKMDLEETDFKI
uniref:ATP-dependent RNA helicase n=1 Tax=Panagrolaimus sp. PS1159 TaxID=55785 RepID=A0AC35GGM0_9BILA